MGKHPNTQSIDWEIRIMSVSREEKEGRIILKIEDSLSIYDVANLRNEFLECLDAYDHLSLDLNGVTECDSAGIQLLCSAYMTARNAGKFFEISGASEQVIETVSLIGLHPDGFCGLKIED
jgi:anti-anti-sigma factor